MASKKNKFSLRVKPQPRTMLSPSAKPWERRKSLAHATVQQEQVDKKRQQIEDAVAWCKQNGVKGYAAINTGQFPLTSARVINRRLDGTVTCGEERDYCSIMTRKEEDMLVRHVKNKNRCYQGMNRVDITNEVVMILNVRKEVNRQFRGRQGTPLSSHALRVIDTHKLGKSFWKRWDTQYHSTLSQKRPGNVSVKRALSCTKEMAIKHLDALADELISLEIFTDAVQIGPGKWRGQIDLTRVFNHDETPQFVNYGVDPTSRALVYCGKGEECKNMISENRECITIHPFVSLAGELIMCHVIFKGNGITSQMAPSEEVVDKIGNLLISTTEHGVQDHASLLDAYTCFETVITKNNVQKPISVMSDGHSSRFDADVMQFMEDHRDHIFIGPSDTTGATQTLDQINQNLHSKYRSSKKKLFSATGTVNREGFMQILAEMWDQWAPPEAIIKAAKRVGISSTGLDVDWMQQDKFESARLLLEEEEVAETSTSSILDSPQGIRKNSTAYFKYKYEKSEELRCNLLEERLDVSKVPGILKVDKAKKAPSKNLKVTNIQGSMTGQNILQVVKKLKEDAEEKEKKKEATSKKKQDDIEKFLRCKDACLCEVEPCLASRLKQCSICHTVQISDCNKAPCIQKNNGSKPDMILPHCSKGTKRKLQVTRQSSDDDEDNDDSESGGSDEDGSETDEDDRGVVQETFKELYKKAIKKDDMEDTWKSLSPPIKECDIVGKWYGMVYASSKQRKMLYIGKVEQRFLLDVDGPVDSISMRCLKPKVGSGAVLEDTPKHLPDVGYFKLEDIIAGPLTVTPIKGNLKYNVHDYEEVKKLFDSVKDLDRKTFL